MKSIREQAWDALSLAAERIGSNDYKRGLLDHTKAGRSKSTYRHLPSSEHMAVVEALGRVLRSDEDAEAGIALLHQYDVSKRRLH